MDSRIKNELETRNKKIIDAVIKKADKLCPGSLALIGIYGSFMTGEIHDKSDLDLMIVINDDNGWGLSSTFICDGIGYDIYCTTWDSLEGDATYNNPNISKLMDSKLVYIADSSYEKRLTDLRQKAKNIMEAPFTEADFNKCSDLFDRSIKALGMINLVDTLGACRKYAGEAVYECCNAICMVNKTYFKLGCKKLYAELELLEKKPVDLVNLIEAIVHSKDINGIRTACLNLVKSVNNFMQEIKQSLDSRPEPGEDLSGSYEEMFSNWHNKMYYAAENGNAHMSFDSMTELQFILDDINSECKIGEFDVLGCYDPDNLLNNAINFDKIHQQYGEVYKKAGIKPVIYANIDEFLQDYLV